MIVGPLHPPITTRSVVNELERKKKKGNCTMINRSNAKTSSYEGNKKGIVG